MLVKMITSVAEKQGSYQANTIYDLPDAQARKYIEWQWAAPIERRTAEVKRDKK